MYASPPLGEKVYKRVLSLLLFAYHHPTPSRLGCQEVLSCSCITSRLFTNPMLNPGANEVIFMPFAYRLTARRADAPGLIVERVLAHQAVFPFFSHALFLKGVYCTAPGFGFQSALLQHGHPTGIRSKKASKVWPHWKHIKGFLTSAASSSCIARL